MVLLTMLVLTMVVVLSIACCSRDCVVARGVPGRLGTAQVLLLVILLTLSLFHAWTLLCMQLMSQGKCPLDCGGRL